MNFRGTSMVVRAGSITRPSEILSKPAMAMSSGDFVAAKFQSFNRSDGNEIIVRKVRAGERSSAVYDLQHVGECALNRWREFVNDGFCSGHPVFAHRPVKTVCPFAKVSDSVGRAEMSRLAAAAVDEITGGQISTLRIVA